MATKLEVYNNALTKLKCRTLSAITDSRTERRSLDRVWNQALKYLLEAGMWNFAAKTSELSPSDTISTEFGYNYVFEKPDDYVRMIKISDNERLNPTLNDFSEEGDYILADCQVLYLQYVSNDSSWGADPGKWTARFADALADDLVYRAAPHLASAGFDSAAALEKKRDRSIAKAVSLDAINQPMAALPVGRLVRSRAGHSTVNAMRRTPYQ